MKRLVFMLLFLTTAFAKFPDIILEDFNWPDPVAREMVKIVKQPGRQIVLNQDQYVLGGYNIIDSCFYKDSTIISGLALELWNYDYNQQNYFLLKDKNNYYWTIGSFEQFQIRKPSKVGIKLQYNYWNSIYSQTIAGSRFDFYVDRKFNIFTKFGSGTILPGIGLSIRYQPSVYDYTYSEQIPMLHSRLSLDWQYQSLYWYLSVGYFRPFELRYNDTWEIYSKLSWRLPSFAKNFKLNFVYFGSQPSDQTWVYSEGKIQILYVYRNWWFGIEPYVASKWQNSDDWVTQNRSYPGNLVLGLAINDFWLEVTGGRYYTESGFIPFVSQSGEQWQFSFNIGTNLYRR